MTFALPGCKPIDASSEASLQRPAGPTPAGAKQSNLFEASYLAHDARNWLTVLQMYCDLLRTPGAVASGRQNWIEELAGAVERGQGLVVSLLDTVQEANLIANQNAIAERGGARATPAPKAEFPKAEFLDVAGALSGRRELLERIAGNGIRVEIHVGPGALLQSAAVAIDESTFERILYNLASNAVEAMPKGGRLRITLRNGRKASAAYTSSTLLLRVFDTGEGMAPERLGAIFDTGVSSKVETENKHRPRGLGLAIVRELTERAGGSVRVRSRPGRGSCFELEFPRAQLAAKASALGDR